MPCQKSIIHIAKLSLKPMHTTEHPAPLTVLTRALIFLPKRIGHPDRQV